MMLPQAAHLVAAATTVGVLAGCASGPMPGLLVNRGQPPERVTLNYESGVFGRTGKLWATLPGGERYAGTYVLTPYAPDHHLISKLDGDRGSSMVCRFRLNEPGVGPDKGGTGQCELSSGGVIDTKF